MQNFTEFKKRILSSKHGIWFSLLSNEKQSNLLKDWENSVFTLWQVNQTPSLRKFLWNSRKNKFYNVPKAKLRDKQLEKLLK